MFKTDEYNIEWDWTYPEFKI